MVQNVEQGLIQNEAIKKVVEVNDLISDLLLDISLKNNWSAYQYYLMREFTDLMLTGDKERLLKAAKAFEDEIGEPFPFMDWIEKYK